MDGVTESSSDRWMNTVQLGSASKSKRRKHQTADGLWSLDSESSVGPPPSWASACLTLLSFCRQCFFPSDRPAFLDLLGYISFIHQKEMLLSKDRSSSLLDSIRYPSPSPVLRNRQMSVPDQVIDIRLPSSQPLPIPISEQPSPSLPECPTPHPRRSSFSLRSSVRNLSFIRSSRLCYSSDSAFTDPIIHHQPAASHRNMNISSPISVTLGRDVQSIPRQPLPHSTSPNPVTLVRTPSEAVRKILSNKTPGPADRSVTAYCHPV